MSSTKRGNKGNNAVTGKISTNVQNASQMPAKSQDKILYRIIQKALARTRQDIAKWRTALTQAENPERPRRQALIKLYADLVLDNHLSGIMDLRTRKSKHTSFRVLERETGEPDWDKTDLIEKEWFYEVIEYILESIYYGHSLIELTFEPPFMSQDKIKLAKTVSETTLIPRVHVIPEWGQVRINENDDNGFPYRGVPAYNIVEAGKKNSLGLLAKAAPSVIYKKNAMAAWSEYCEIFGMPLRVGKTTSRDQAHLDKIENALRDMGSAAYALVNDTDTIEFIESTKGDAYNVYDKLIDRANSELSKLIISVTMLSDNGSSKSQSEVHERVADDIVIADRFLLKFIINDKLFPILVANGYPFEGMKFEWDTTQDPSLEKQWEIIEGLIKLGYEIPEEYLIETFGVPIEGRKIDNTNTKPENALPDKYDPEATLKRKTLIEKLLGRWGLRKKRMSR